jgi:hypothetical protein
MTRQDSQVLDEARGMMNNEYETRAFLMLHYEEEGTFAPPGTNS